MKLLITKDCDSHRVNPDYRTLLVFLSRKDGNVRLGPQETNWQPTDSEVLELVEALAELSPTFAEQLVNYAVGLNVWHSPEPRSRRKVTNLAEMLL